MLQDEKKLQVTLNLFKKLSNDATLDQTSLIDDLNDLKNRMESVRKPDFLQAKVFKSSYYLTNCAR